MQIIHKVPWLLVTTRALIAGLFFALTLVDAGAGCRWLCFALVLVGSVGDILDGVIARAHGVATPLFRRTDSVVDVLFWTSLAGLVLSHSKTARSPVLFGFVTILPVVLSEYLTSLVRFRRTASAHNRLSRFFGALMTAYFSLALVSALPPWTGYVVFSIGIAARLDALVIYLTLKEWASDIPSSFHARLMRG